MGPNNDNVGTALVVLNIEARSIGSLVDPLALYDMTGGIPRHVNE